MVGGHIWIGGLAIAGGIWHLSTEPLLRVQNRLVWNSDTILSYSLSGVALAAFISAYFVAFNDTVFPPVFYSSDRAEFASVQVLLGTIFLGGHIWHALRSRTNWRRLTQTDVVEVVVAGFGFLFVLMSGLGLLAMDQVVF